jgi:hypothetical protein
MKVPVPMLPMGGSAVGALVAVVLLIGLAVYVVNAPVPPASQSPRR